MSAYNGGASNRFFADWPPEMTDPNDDYWQDGATIAARSWDLWRNDPYFRALIETMVEGVVGPDGLRHRSLYQEDGSPETDPSEQRSRDAIDAAVKRATTKMRLDASGVLTYPEMSEAVYRSCKVAGMGYAVNVWKPGRPDAYQGGAWRIIDAARVSNPKHAADSPTMFQGHELDSDGREVAIHVQRSHPNIQRIAPASEWQRIPIYDKDGVRRVAIRRNSARPEAIRTLGCGAPVMLYLRMLQGTTEAWAIAKRIQASYALMIKTEDPKAAANADRYGSQLASNAPTKPGMRYYHNYDKVEPLNWNFQGNDYEQFRNPIIEAVTAAEGVPYELVLKRLTKSNLASSRAALLTYYQFCRREQNRQIGSVESVWAESIIREDIARGRLVVKSQDWDEITRCRWLRAPRVWPDPQKEANAARAWVDMGRSLTSVYDEAGFDFEDEIMQRARDNQFMVSQDVSIAGDTVAERIITEPQAVEPAIDANGDPVETPEEDAADAEEDMKPTEPAAVLKTFSDQQAGERRELRDMLLLMTSQGRGHPSHTIHTDMRAEAIKEVLSLMPPPVVHFTPAPVAAPVVTVAPPVIHVDAPAVTVTPNFTVQAAESPAPVVNVNLPAPIVNNDVRVEVPARKVIARPGSKPGEVIMEPQ